jgi:parallel beta-helix repeat protein
VNYSDWGYGTLQAGDYASPEYDGTVLEASLANYGIEITGVIKNCQIKNNILAGGARGISFTVGASPEDLIFDNCSIEGNTFFNTGDYGVFWQGSSTSEQNVRVFNNVFDIDPFITHANRGSNGTWAANTLPVGIYLANVSGFSVENNDFKNCCIPQ